jgi:hypothetical protein
MVHFFFLHGCDSLVPLNISILENGRLRRPGSFFVSQTLFAFPAEMQKAFEIQAASDAEAQPLYRFDSCPLRFLGES